MKLYNSLSFKKEEFKPINPKEISMYVCGPTVYDSPHLGHAKSAVAFDLMRRYFKFKGFEVKLVKNYTDIDDKIIQRANERGIDYKTLSERYIKEYEEIMDILNIQKDYKNPRATEVIDFMIEIVQGLISKDYAYESNGSVYFDVKSFAKYKTILQNISEEDLEEEEEEEIEYNHIEEKRNPKDFALWKKSKEDEPFWESPWGKGRPGWHIECSAMAINFLSETIDIHGGGQDLKFPHHRNEISQSEAYTGKPFANYFMHNGFVNVDNEKMSKSLGNFFLVSDVAKEYDPMVIRLFLISTHYRKSVNYSLDNMDQAKKNYAKLINAIQKIHNAPAIEHDTNAMNELISKINRAESNLINAMDDDFNTPVAIAEIMVLFREINRIVFEEDNKINRVFKERLFKFIELIDQIFGLFPNIENQLVGQLDLSIAGSFDKRGKLIEDLLEIIKNARSGLREEKVFDISDDIREKINDFYVRKELGLSLGGSFDERGVLISDLIEVLKNLSKWLEERGNSELSKKISEKIENLGLTEEISMEVAGSFDLRGELINKLVDFFTEIRSEVRKTKNFDVSDYICEKLGHFWITRELDIERAGSFDKRGVLIDELLDVIDEIRSELRKRKLYTFSDNIREKMEKLGIKIEDN